MKHKKKIKVFSALLLTLTVFLSATSCGRAEAPERTKDIAVLYTNDVHCAVDSAIGYAGLAAMKTELENSGNEVLLVDSGDAVQGAPIGSLSEGKLPIDIMNKLGYSAMVLGNHEFDYGLETLKTLSEQAEFPLLSLNFCEKEGGKAVYSPYTIVERDGVKIAFVGISTPETLTSSRPANFMDSSGNFIYTFLQDESGKALWDRTQQTVDAARSDGAEYVIALTHLGISASSSPYTSSELIANTTGIDAVLDGHSHSVIECERVRSKDGKAVLLSSTGSGLSHIGYLLITRSGSISTGLVSEHEKKDESVTAYIDGLKAEFDGQLNAVVAKTDVSLITEDPETNVRLVRNVETNLGDLCADAIRTAAKADVAVMNGGGIRAGLAAGEITYNSILSVFPFGNHLCTIQVTGQQLLDALELSVRAAPDEYGGFLQVSGLTFEFSTSIPSPVSVDSSGMFTGIDGERRVQNVLVGGEKLNPDGNYSLAGIDYTLCDSGDGYAMFADCPLLEADIALDFDALVSFLAEIYPENAEAYANPYGEGRIAVVS